MKELFPHGQAFPYRLVDKRDKGRTCWFSCEEHVHKHILRYSIKDAIVDVMDGHSYSPPKVSKPRVKRTVKKKPSMSTIEDFFK